MKYTVDMGSGGMIYIPISIKIGSGIQKLIGGGGFTDTQTTCRSHEPTSGEQAEKQHIVLTIIM
jgi:hypothetical protein